MDLFTSYPDIVKSFLLPLIIAIFTIAFPLLFQTAIRIDDKYKSTLLVKLFRIDWRCKIFIWSLICALVFSIIWSFQFPRVIDFGRLNKLVENSAFILLTISCGVLTLATILIATLIYIYYVPSLLLKYLIHHYQSYEQKNQSQYINAISNMLYYSIRTLDNEIAKQVYEFYASIIESDQSSKNDRQYVDLSPELINAFIDANDILCTSDNSQVSYFVDHPFYSLIFQVKPGLPLSNRMYDFLWTILRQYATSGKDDYIVKYWDIANSYYKNCLQPLLNHLQNEKTINQKEVDERETQRDRFKELNYALGGLLLSLKKYDLLRKIISCSNTMSYDESIFPLEFREIIPDYFECVERQDATYYYALRYPFPNVIEGDVDTTIRLSIKRLLSLLFLRQFVLDFYFFNGDSLVLPYPFPDSLREKKKWLDGTDDLISNIKSLRNDADYLTKFQMQELSDDKWFIDHGKETPEEILDVLKDQLNSRMNVQRSNLKIDDDKKKQFDSKTATIILDLFAEYAPVLNIKTDNINYCSKDYLICMSYPLKKTAFSSDQDISYSDYDSVLALIVSNSFKENYLNVLFDKISGHYYFDQDLALQAIDLLCLDKDKYVIVAVGLFIPYLLMNSNEINDNNRECKYKGIPIIAVNNGLSQQFRQSLLIMRKEDLPYLIHLPAPQEKITKYTLEQVDNDKNIYASLVDLSSFGNEFIKTLITTCPECNLTSDTISQFLLGTVCINVEIGCPQSAKIIQITVGKDKDGKFSKLSEMSSVCEGSNEP